MTTPLERVRSAISNGSHSKLQTEALLGDLARWLREDVDNGLWLMRERMPPSSRLPCPLAAMLASPPGQCGVFGDE